jgi:hypothetical protein
METKIKVLKKKIENRLIDDSFLVLSYRDSSFIANHYVTEIAKIKNKQKISIDSLEQMKPNDVFEPNDNGLYILHVDEFDSNITNFQPYKNYVVICNKITERTRDKVVETAVYCSLPKLEEWQILDYIKFTCSGLTEGQVKYLYDISDGDIYRINNELLKISLFDKNIQSEIFKQIDSEGGYSDLSRMTIFNLTNATIKKSVGELSKVMSEISSMKLDGILVFNILYKNLKNIIDVKLNTKSNPESIGMSDKQYKAISYSYNNISSTKIINMFEFITSVDLKLKSGMLQMSDERFIDYLICNLLSF